MFDARNRTACMPARGWLRAPVIFAPRPRGSRPHPFGLAGLARRSVPPPRWLRFAGVKVFFTLPSFSGRKSRVTSHGSADVPRQWDSLVKDQPARPGDPGAGALSAVFIISSRIISRNDHPGKAGGGRGRARQSEAHPPVQALAALQARVSPQVGAQRGERAVTLSPCLFPLSRSVGSPAFPAVPAWLYARESPKTRLPSKSP